MRGLGGLLFGMLAVSGTAEAGPWTQAPGGIYARGIISSERLDGEDGWRGDLYGEYGLTSHWTVTGKVESVRYEYGGVSDRDAYRLSVRRQLWSNEAGWVAGAEAGLIHGSAVAGVYGCEGWGSELRASVGRSGTYRERDYYLFGGFAQINQENGCSRQRLEFGYGADIGGHFFTSQQLWLEQGNQSARSIKSDTQLGYHFPLVDVALGFREEYGGEFDEQAWLLAFTVRR